MAWRLVRPTTKVFREYPVISRICVAIATYPNLLTYLNSC